MCALVSHHLKTCTAHLSIELWKMRYINNQNVIVRKIKFVNGYLDMDDPK